MKWKKFFIILGVLIAVWAIVHTVWASSGRGSVEERLQELESQGLTFTFREAMGEKIAEADNAFPGLLATAKWLRKQAPFDEIPKFLLEFPSQWTEEQRTEAKAWIEKREDLFERLRQDLERKGFYIDLDSAEATAEALSGLRELSSRASMLLIAKAVLDESPTLEHAQDSIELSLALEDRIGPLGIFFFWGRIDLSLRTFQALRLLARKPAFVPTAFESVITHLDQLLGSQAIDRALAIDRAMLMENLDDIKHRSGMQAWIFRPFLFQNALAHLEQLEWMRANAEVPHEDYEGARKGYFDEPPSYWFLGDHAAGLAPQTLDLYHEARAELALCKVAMRVLSAKKQTGNLPASLDELGENQTLPSDPYTGEPFLYSADDKVLKTEGPRYLEQTEEQKGIERLRWSLDS